MLNNKKLYLPKPKPVRLADIKSLKWLNQPYYARDWAEVPLLIGKAISALFPPQTSGDFKHLRTSSGTLFASRGHLFRDAVFGRDSLESAEDILFIKPKIARGVILRQAELQGNVLNAISEEEPGKIAHEYRAKVIDGRPISAESQVIFEELSNKWGGDENAMIYYGSVDATPLFARLVVRYCRLYGTAILDEVITRRDGREATVRDCVIAALEWIVSKKERSDIGLVEFRSDNPLGIRNQVWTDSASAYVHADGSPPNHAAPVAPLEVQGYSYDALTGGAAVLDGVEELQKRNWQKSALDIRGAVIKHFWSAKDERFATAVDRHPLSGKPRKIKTSSSNDGLLLETTFFDSLAKADRDKYVLATVKHVYSDEFLTPVGLRCRAKSLAHLVDFQDYHGSWAVWTKQTFDIAKGMRYQGFPQLAQQLEARILNGVVVAGVNYEFFYVDPDGTVVYKPKAKTKDDPNQKVILGTNIPEGGQAWTVTAVMAIKRRQFRRSPLVREKDQKKIEAALLKKFPRVNLINRSAAILTQKNNKHSYVVDMTEGVERDRRWNPEWWRNKTINA